MTEKNEEGLRFNLRKDGETIFDLSILPIVINTIWSWFSGSKKEEEKK